MPYTSAAFAPCGVRTWCVLGAMVPLQGHDRTASTSTPKQPPAPEQRGQPDSSTRAMSTIVYASSRSAFKNGGLDGQQQRRFAKEGEGGWGPQGWTSRRKRRWET